MLDEASLWLAGLAWLGWLLLGNGRIRLTSADRIQDHGTAAVALGTLLGCLGLALVLAVDLPAAKMPGPAWAPRIAGACIAGVGIGLRELAVRSLGSSFTQIVTTRSEQTLVTSGPYRYIRHPGYAGSILTLTGLGLTLGNWGSLGVLAFGTLVGHLPRIRVEEHALEERFSDGYREYERTHARLVPRVW